MMIPSNMEFKKVLQANRFWIIGDIHGMYDKFQDLLIQIVEYESTTEHGFGAYDIVCVGDLMDRGQESLKVLRTFMEKELNTITGNHDNKLWRYLAGSKVEQLHGIESTIAELNTITQEERDKIRDYLGVLPLTIELQVPNSKYNPDNNSEPEYLTAVVAHAGFHPKFHGWGNIWSPKRTVGYSIFGPTREPLPNGLPDRIEWENNYYRESLDEPYVFYGHRIIGDKPKFTQHTCGLDTGCYESGILTAVSWPDLEVLQTK